MSTVFTQLFKYSLICCGFLAIFAMFTGSTDTSLPYWIAGLLSASYLFLVAAWIAQRLELGSPYSYDEDEIIQWPKFMAALGIESALHFCMLLALSFMFATIMTSLIAYNIHLGRLAATAIVFTFLGCCYICLAGEIILFFVDKWTVPPTYDDYGNEIYEYDTD